MSTLTPLHDKLEQEKKLLAEEKRRAEMTRRRDVLRRQIDRLLEPGPDATAITTAIRDLSNQVPADLVTRGGLLGMSGGMNIRDLLELIAASVARDFEVKDERRRAQLALAEKQLADVEREFLSAGD